MNDFDLNGNRFYMEYVVERGSKPTGKITKVAAAVCAVFRIAEGLAGMPAIHGKEKSNKKGQVIRTIDRSSDITHLLTKRPNDWMTAVEFFEHMTMRAIVEGTAQAYVKRTRNGKPKALIPADLQSKMDESAGIVTYSGTVPGEGNLQGIKTI